MAENPGGVEGLNFNSDQNPGGNPPADPASASAQAIAGRKERSDKGKLRGPRGAKDASGIPPISAQQFALIYSPEVWARVLCSPADAAAVITGRKHFEFQKQERENIGAVGAVAAQCFATADPRWLAVAIALIVVVDTYAMHTAAFYMERKVEKDKQRREQKPAANVP